MGRQRMAEELEKKVAGWKRWGGWLIGWGRGTKERKLMGGEAERGGGKGEERKVRKRGERGWSGERGRKGGGGRGRGRGVKGGDKGGEDRIEGKRGGEGR